MRNSKIRLTAIALISSMTLTLSTTHATVTQSQTRKTGIEQQKKKITPSTRNQDRMVVLYDVDKLTEKPEFSQAIDLWFKDNLPYKPNSDITARLKLIIERNGKVIGAEIIRASGDNTLDRSLASLATSDKMPRWSPGLIDGVPVRCSYPVTITFEASSPATNSNSAEELDLGTDDIHVPIVEKSEAVAAEGKTYDEGKIYNPATVEQLPTFPGGMNALNKWLSSHLIYPTEAANDNIQGRVIVSFIIERDGSISDVKVLRGRHPSLDKEAVRVVRSMPKWVPGKNNGHPVRVSCNVPISFKLAQ